MPAARQRFSCDGCGDIYRIKRRNDLVTNNGVMKVCNNCYITCGGIVPRPGRFNCFTCHNEVRCKKENTFYRYSICKGCIPRCEQCNRQYLDIDDMCCDD